MYKNILLFGGTTEGRIISEYLNLKKINVDICVVSEYGKEVLLDDEYINVKIGRLNKNEMTDLMLKNKYDFVIDATHPFATEVTENIKNSAKDSKIVYKRVLRDDVTIENSYIVNSYDNAIDILNKEKGNILLTIGSKEILKFKDVIDYESRVFARVLPTIDAIEQCKKLGLKGKNIIGMQGPFSKELNVAMLKQLNCEFMVTKASGNFGGVKEKIESSSECGVKLIAVKLPEKKDGFSINKMKEEIDNYYGK